MDLHSRAIAGWTAATHNGPSSCWTPCRWRCGDGHAAGPGLVHHSDAGSQYTSFAFTAYLIEAGIGASIGTVGDASGNALMESTIGLYKTELIEPRGPWRSFADVELGHR